MNYSVRLAGEKDGGGLGGIEGHRGGSRGIEGQQGAAGGSRGHRGTGGQGHGGTGARGHGGTGAVEAARGIKRHREASGGSTQFEICNLKSAI